MPSEKIVEHKPYGWWYTPKNKSFEDRYFIGYKESVAFIRQTLIEQGPFDGILGFSQGASFAAILTELLEKQSPEFRHHDPLKFSILVSGFRPNLQEAPSWLLMKKQGLKTPTLHCIGDSDTWVSPEKSFTLTQLFENPVIFRHSGGHYLPSTPTSQEAFARFLHSIKPMSH
ncbi:unnamed protein product [Rhizopus stolonifer]